MADQQLRRLKTPPMPSRTATKTSGSSKIHKKNRATKVSGPRKVARHSTSSVSHRSGLPLRHKVAAIVWFSTLIVVAMTLFRETIAQLGNWGYVGAFVINGISSASVVLPAPGGAIVLLMAKDYNPLLLGIAAGLGGALGSLTAYLVGVHAQSALQGRRLYSRAHRLMHRFGSVILILATLMPISPGDFVGVLAGATRYPIRKYLIYVTIASVIKMTVMVYAAIASFAWLEEWLGRWSELSLK